MRSYRDEYPRRPVGPSGKNGITGYLQAIVDDTRQYFEDVIGAGRGISDNLWDVVSRTVEGRHDQPRRTDSRQRRDDVRDGYGHDRNHTVPAEVAAHLDELHEGLEALAAEIGRLSAQVARATHSGASSSVATPGSSAAQETAADKSAS
ncbi:hypothetical protein ACSNOI_13440 [Actinomadura kijaniata]|uniref:hypothetical protein n=1 Tax=Actinomadura kijaniata TaxID=46161 RepID=UPI003F1C8F79